MSWLAASVRFSILSRSLLIAALAASLTLAGRGQSPSHSAPIRLDPVNPHYFLFRGKTVTLITSGEHYGAVLNLDVDGDRYLATIQSDGLNLTRLFGGSYVEVPGKSFGIQRNDLAPAPGRFLAPWARSSTPGYAGGGNKFDLDHWNPEYFDRLHRFLKGASERGIVVELTLFSNSYGDAVWALNPLRAENNVQGIGKLPWYEYNTLHNAALVDRQLAHVRKMLEETSGYDNVYYEICNEPGGNASPQATVADVDAWQARITGYVRSELERLGHPHLVFGSQAFSYKPAFRQDLDASFTQNEFDAVNVHPLPGMVLGGREYMLGNFMSKQLALRDFRDFCHATHAFKKPCVSDEDNAASMFRDPVGWTIHRKRAWMAVLSQCHYDYIDFSIQAGLEAGTPDSRRMIRTWMKHLCDFVQTFDFVHARLARGWIVEKPKHLVDTALALADGGYIAYLADDREVADPTAGRPISGKLVVHLPAGDYRVRFYSPVKGSVTGEIPVRGDAAPAAIELPRFEQDFVVLVSPAKSHADHHAGR